MKIEEAILYVLAELNRLMREKGTTDLDMQTELLEGFVTLSVFPSNELFCDFLFQRKMN